MDETEFPIFSKFSVFIFLMTLWFQPTPSRANSHFSRFKVSKGVSDLAPPLPNYMFFFLFGDVSNI